MNKCADLKNDKGWGGRPSLESGVTGQNFWRQAEAKSQAAAAHINGGRQKPRFLVVEDMAQLAGLFVQCLEALDIEAEVASTGGAALRLLSNRSFDVALVDIELPDMKGFEVVEAAQASGWLRNTRIVFCTGSRSEEYRQRAARFSGSGFLWKPFNMQDLVQCIEGLNSASNQPHL